MGSILGAFERLVRDGRHRPAIWSRAESRRLDFGDLAEEVDAWLGRLDLPQGEPTCLAVGNRIAFPAICLALLRARVPMVMMEASVPSSEKISICRELGIGSLLHVEHDGQSLGDGVHLTEIPIDEPPVFPAGSALIKLTSGSTGAPLAACYTEEALHQGIQQIAAGMEITQDDRVLMAIPLSHSYGFDNGMLSLAVLGTPLVLTANIFPRPMMAALEEAAITFFPTVPPIVRSLAECDCQWPSDLKLRKVICAGAPLRPEHADAFHRRTDLHVHQFYGCTEVGGISFERQAGRSEALGTVGHPLPGVRIQLGAGDEVIVHSEAAFCGHMGHDGKALEKPPVRPGDRGEWTPEGRLRLIGRTTDILNVGGRKISVVKVEQALRELGGVTDVAVIGAEDAIRGDRIVAFVVADRDDLDTSSLPRALAPREVIHIEKLPVTERGKLDRAQLHEMARGSR